MYIYTLNFYEHDTLTHTEDTLITSPSDDRYAQEYDLFVELEVDVNGAKMLSNALVFIVTPTHRHLNHAYCIAR